MFRVKATIDERVVFSRDVLLGAQLGRALVGATFELMRDVAATSSEQAETLENEIVRGLANVSLADLLRDARR